ncbi:HNH endonuclease [Umezawaea beigongshangensis]|uniref:HNH endonuclease n=1 Tax=Umezawaea beigongshangensis TaxID=2780383 RepID=UPI0018F1C8FA|nr:HNH endonuclease [Umezawaea beigongshangensis]
MAESQQGRAARLELELQRDGPTCAWCAREFGSHVVPTTDHLVPRVKGGPSRLENEVAACRRCNRERGHRSPVDWLEECGRRGWTPDAGRVLRVLTSLEEVVAVHGGHRRARPYLDNQLRRLRKHDQVSDFQDVHETGPNG